MKKSIIIAAIVVLLFAAGVLSVTVVFKDFFFTTKYYDDPMIAYNSNAAHSPVGGDQSAQRAVGVYKISEDKALFIGEMTSERIVVAEMVMKNSKYAFEGTTYVLERGAAFNENAFDQTNTDSGFVKWMVVFDRQDADELSGTKDVKEYSLSGGSLLYLVIFD
ncbi:MAG: hypothetical protein IJV00_07505 [Clostridia bacterium]|nr:hypothetical protein [Clostridia bacterium]